MWVGVSTTKNTQYRATESRRVSRTYIDVCVTVLEYTLTLLAGQWGGGTAHSDKRKSRPCFLAEIVLTVQSVRNLLINSYDHVVNLLYYSTVNKLSMIMKFSILLLVRPKR